MLVEKGADTNIQDNAGRTALMLAASKGNNLIINKLLSADAEPGLRGRDGKTASAWAVEKGHESAARPIDAASRK